MTKLYLLGVCKLKSNNIYQFCLSEDKNSKISFSDSSCSSSSFCKSWISKKTAFRLHAWSNSALTFKNSATLNVMEFLKIRYLHEYVMERTRELRFGRRIHSWVRASNRRVGYSPCRGRAILALQYLRSYFG